MSALQIVDTVTPSPQEVDHAFQVLAQVFRNPGAFDTDSIAFGAQSVFAAALCRVDPDPIRSAVLDVLNEAIRTGHIRMVQV